ncbi:MAG: alpha-glucan family phosphorylase [Gammaproteobacteria bacterium]|nr:alpha-glucan family phosphorylase [Gammaproteobacteria bacterium]
MNTRTPLLQKLPPELEPYADFITDLRWTWSHAGDWLWKTIDKTVWDQTDNPYVVLQNLSQTRLKNLANNREFMQKLEELAEARHEYCSRDAWYQLTHKDTALRGVAYLSLEFGLGQALPFYAGGLGVLAGDHLKAASDLGVPLTGIGLLYQEGYFRQVLDADGWQQEVYPYNDSTSLPLRPLEAETGEWLHVSIRLPGRWVRLRVWQAQVGRVALYLLDSNDPLNSANDRGITSKLYGGGQELRLAQEIALGIGGWLLIEALNLPVDVCHLNEGHAAFVTLERARHFMHLYNVNFWEALWATRAGNVFTTHTPVSSGFDVYSMDLLGKYGREYAELLGVSGEELASLGRKNPDDSNEPFNMAYLAARTCRSINGVSQLHGEVSKDIFQKLYPRWPTFEVPITHVTNGVHVPSWDSAWADEIWTKAAGKDRWLGGAENLADAINDVDDAEMWELRGRERVDLVRRARRRLARQFAQRGADTAAIEGADIVLDPNTLTLGFARRFTEYKRPNLLLTDAERFVRLLTRPDKPVQIIVAGKAHPQDQIGKQFVREWAKFASRPEVRAHVVFLEDYDIALAQEMVQGVDVWINTPRRPWEACGTSGMKVLVNGGLNLSSLDGWWVEAYSPEVGWALGDNSNHGSIRWDASDAEQLYGLLEREIVPMFYDRNACGLPRNWIAKMRNSMAKLAPQFSGNRMVREYVERIYLPAANVFQLRSQKGGALAKQLWQWQRHLGLHWQGIHYGELQVMDQNNHYDFELQVYLGDIPRDHVQVQVFAKSMNDESAYCKTMQCGDPIPGTTNGYVYSVNVPADRPPQDYTPRIIPYFDGVQVPTEMGLIHWQR